MWGQEGERQRKGGGWEDSQSFGKDVGGGLRLEEVRVELVAVEAGQSKSKPTKNLDLHIMQHGPWIHQIELIYTLQLSRLILGKE